MTNRPCDFARSFALAVACACALAGARAADAADASAKAAGTAAAPAMIPGCVAALKDVRSGSGAKSFASHYVTVGEYGYGEFLAGTFGSQSLWHKRGTLWCRVETGTALLDRAGIVAAGVPPATADALLAKMRAGHELAPPKPAPSPPRLPGAQPQVHHR